MRRQYVTHKECRINSAHSGARVPGLEIAVGSEGGAGVPRGGVQQN